MSFNYKGLFGNQFWGFYTFKSFCSYACDKEQQVAYYKKCGMLSTDSSGELRWAEISPTLLASQLDDNETAMDIIKNQMVVFLVTKFEAIIEDAMKCLLVDKPENIPKLLKKYADYKTPIKEYLENYKAGIPYEDKVEKIGEYLSKRCLSGKVEKVQTRVKTLLDFQDWPLDKLQKLQEKRNCIVHESKIYEISLEELEEYYKVIEEVLNNIAWALKDAGFQIDGEGSLRMQTTRGLIEGGYLDDIE